MRTVIQRGGAVHLEVATQRVDADRQRIPPRGILGIDQEGPVQRVLRPAADGLGEGGEVERQDVARQPDGARETYVVDLYLRIDHGEAGARPLDRERERVDRAP